MWRNKGSVSERKVPQRRGFPRVAAPVVLGETAPYTSTAKRMRCLLVVCLFCIGTLVVLVPALRSRGLGLLMLFTQKSVHTLAGALRAAGPLARPTSLWLMAVQSVCLPWMPPLLPLANGMVFGTVAGAALSLIGSLLAGSLCFGLSRLFLRPVFARLEPCSIRSLSAQWGGPGCWAALLSFPGSMGFVGYLAGASALPYRRFVVSAVLGQAPVLAAYTRYCSPFQTLLPRAPRQMLILLAGIFLAINLALGLFRRSRKRYLR